MTRTACALGKRLINQLLLELQLSNLIGQAAAPLGEPAIGLFGEKL
jgi:hypothetical protein